MTGSPADPTLPQEPATQGLQASAPPPTHNMASGPERYRAMHLHACGGLGEVHLAQDIELGRVVALKRVRPDFVNDPANRERFLREAEITARLEHPGIVPVYGLVHDAAGQPAYAMRFVEGETLADAIQRYHEAPNHLAFRQLLTHFVAVCQAVAYAHSHGVLHRDLKPGNILLGRFGETLVIDWGLARSGPSPETMSAEDGRTAPSNGAEDGSGTQLGEALGTPAYMSPEQAAGQWHRVGPASDVYSLGTTLYHLLTGQIPFAGTDIPEILARVQRGDHPPVRQVRSDTPRSLDAICAKAMALQPAQRYPTALALAEDVQRWLADEAVSVGREPLQVRLGRWTRRHRGAAAALAAAVLVGLLGLGSSSLILGVKNRALKRANEQESQARQQAEAAKNLAEQRFALARNAVDKYLNAVAEDPDLSQKHNLHPLRKKLLETAIPFYQQLAAQKPGDPEQQAAQGHAYWRLARVHEVLGEKKAALEDHQELQTIFERLATEQPTVPEHRQRLADSLNSIGVLLRSLGDRAAARRAFDQAATLQEKLTAEFPDVSSYPQELARTRENLSILLWDQGDRVAARRAAEEAIKLQRQLVADHPEEVVHQRELAVSLSNLGTHLRELGQKVDARKLTEEGIALQEGLVATNPEVAPLRSELVNSYQNLGLLLTDSGDRPGARRAHERASSLAEKLATDFASVPAYRQKFARSQNFLGMLLRDQGDRPAAQRAYEQALTQQRKLVAEHPGVPEYRLELAASLNNFGVLLQDMNDAAGARRVQEEALKLREQIAAEMPDVPAHAISLGGSYCNYGHLLRSLGKPAEALPWYDKAIGSLQPFLQGQSVDLTAQRYARNTRFGRASALQALGRFQEAVLDWDQTLALSETPGPAFYHIQKALCLVRLQQIPQGIAEVDKGLQGRTATPEQLRDAARVLALAATAEQVMEERERHAVRAVALLRAAVAAGYKDVARLKKEPAWQSLRGRKDFQEVLGGLEGEKR